MPNRLAAESSPYLQQHASNPVDWYPWGEEAFARARAEDRPVLLSVGYSSCHWCHVMAHESFEQPETAALMNQWFVNIKVDREERPDIDAVYMAAVQALTGQGGWPMTVFMTPDGRPFYAGTYFPPVDGHGRPGFPRLLEFLAEKWRDERAQVLESADGITSHLQAAAAHIAPAAETEAVHALDAAVATFQETFDPEWGGFGMAPKFPSPSNLEFLVAAHARLGPSSEGAPGPLDLVLPTLRAMASGGIYDQLGGGFARYSVDERWMVPHFEKMLYDNAQLARVYAHAWQVTGDDAYRRTAAETLEFLTREMQHPDGGFYAALDADSEGVEGTYYLWTPGQMRAVLGEDAPLAQAWFGVDDEGNFRDPHHPELTGRSVLSARQEPQVLAARFGVSIEGLGDRVAAARKKLNAARSRRVRPALDDKVLTSWNGLALAAFAEAGRAFGDARWGEVAVRLASWLRANVWRDGRLLHTWTDGRASVDGMLEDYAYLGLGLVETYKLTGELAWLGWARELYTALLERFQDDVRGGFFDTAADAEALLVRQRSLFDAATPSGNGAAALLGQWLERYYGDPAYGAAARQIAAGVSGYLGRAATGFGAILQAMEFELAPHREIVVVGASADRAPFERVLGENYLPFAAIAPTADATGLPMFEGRGTAPGAVAYVCEDMVCQQPTRDVATLRAQLRG